MTSRNLISAIFISLHLSVVLVLLYLFFPVLFLLLRAILGGTFSHGPKTNGIAAAVGGVSDWLVILIVASILFALVFILLQKRSRKG